VCAFFAAKQPHSHVDYLRLDAVYAVLHNTAFLELVYEQHLWEAKQALQIARHNLAGTAAAHYLSACLIRLCSSQADSGSCKDSTWLYDKCGLPGNAVAAFAWIGDSVKGALQVQLLMTACQCELHCAHTTVCCIVILDKHVITHCFATMLRK